VLLAAAAILTVRFASGLGAVTNLSQAFPWGLWKGFCVISGVAFAGGAYVIAFMVYVLGVEKYRPVLRATVLNGFLAYVFYAGALLLDLGRPWNVMNPIIGNSFGLSSVLFLIAWHFLLYTVAQFVEIAPAAAEWLGMRRLHRILEAMTLGAVVLGITLSTLHQSGLGALYLMAEPKLHPLWYSEFLPVMFFVSSIFGGLAMVIFQGSIMRSAFNGRVSPALRRGHQPILLGLGRVCAGAMFVYLFLELLTLIHGRRAGYVLGGWGALYLAEVIGLVALPMLLFLHGYRSGGVRLIQAAAVLTMLGVLLNRLNISVIAYNWTEPIRYVPTWQEFVVAAAVVCAHVQVFRWVVNRMPIVSDPPAWAARHEAA
jgi:Ni/Fe-hydrogenase subunit HybB-like protein